GLEVETAAVEADALADNCDTRVAGLSPFELDEARSPLRRGRGSHGRDQRIAGGELIAGRHPDLGAATVGLIANGLFEFGRTEVGRRRVHEIADERGGFGQPHGLLDLRRFAGEQHALSALGLVRLRSIFVEAMLREQPAERRNAWMALSELVRAIGQRLSQLRQAPWREVTRRLYGAEDFEIVAARQDHESEGRFCVEAMRFDEAPIIGGARLEP